MWVLSWPKNGPASTASAGTGRNSSAVVSSDHRESARESPPNCCGLGKFLVKLTRRSKMLMQRRRITGSQIRGSTHYDPHSYSLNFDSGFGNLLDQDSCRFHAFSSRYAAANPSAVCSK